MYKSIQLTALLFLSLVICLFSAIHAKDFCKQKDIASNRICSTKLYDRINRTQNIKKVQRDYRRVSYNLKKEGFELADFLLHRDILFQKRHSKASYANESSLLSTFLDKSKEGGNSWSMQEVVKYIPLRMSAYKNSSDTKYFRGIHYFNKNYFTSSLRLLSQVEPGNINYLSARFHMAFIYLVKRKTAKSIKTFNFILHRALKEEKLSQAERQYLYYQSAINLARIANDNGYYEAAVKYYDLIKKPHHLWVEAQYEQACALIWNNEYNRSLGNLHSLHSPYLSNSFFPEARLLEMIIYFKLCEYHKATWTMIYFLREILPIEKKLTNYLKTTQEVKPFHFFRLMDKFMRGTDESYFPIPKKLLTNYSYNTQFNLEYQRVLQIQKEIILLSQTDANFRSSPLGRKLFILLNTEKKNLIDSIGTKVKGQLKQTLSEIKMAKKQAKYLHIDLTINQKNDLLGIKTVVDKLWDSGEEDDESGIHHGTWEHDTKNEFWWDEVGHYQFDLQSKCEKKGEKL